MEGAFSLSHLIHYLYVFIYIYYLNIVFFPVFLVSDPIRTDLQPTRWELLCPFTVINFLFHLSLCSIWTVSGLRCRSWRRTAGRSVTSCGLILHLTACCVKPCSTTCPLSHLQPTLMMLSTPCPTSSSACSTTLMPQRCSKVSDLVLIFYWIYNGQWDVRGCVCKCFCLSVFRGQWCLEVIQLSALWSRRTCTA